MRKGTISRRKEAKFQKLQSQISTVNILDSSRSSFLSYASPNKKIFVIDSRGVVIPVDPGFEKNRRYNLEFLLRKDKVRKKCLLLRSRVQISQIRGKKITNLDSYVEEFVESSPVRSNETEKGEENINIENIRPALLRDEAVNTSKTQISLPSF